MSPERWRQVEELYHSALECEPARRTEFLTKACNGDDGLRREVESLLAQPSGDGPLARPAWEGAGTLLELRVTQIVLDAQLGPYKIEALIGDGGMGKVFRGRDTRLGRAVAIKVVDEKFSERFEREARAISALNHPYICTLYDVGPNYLVMEVCEGETLAARLQRGKLSMQDTVRYGAQIAEALAAAHAKGIVHRDLKPGNIMIAKSGVKVLDFGLAKSQHDATMTATNMVMGTPAYMAPEQREGKECDARTDTYSLGLVLYEMATGKRTEQGQTPAMEHLPEKLAHVIERCVAQEPEDRWQSTADLCRELQWIENRGAEAATPSRAAARGKLRERLAWGAAAVLAVGFALVAFFHFREEPPASAVPLRFQVPLSENPVGYPVLSPDGRKVAFWSGGRLWVHFLESGESRDLAAATSAAPFWSPDSRFIGYPSEGKLKKIEAGGGPAQTVTDLHINPSWGAGAWNQDDVIIFSDGSVGFFRVPASGGVPIQITSVDFARHENFHFGPCFLPDARHFLYIRRSTEEGKSAIYLGSLDAKPEEQSSQALVASNSQPKYAPSADPGTGYLLFTRGITLMAQPFDNHRLEVKGQASPVAEQVRNNSAGATYIDFSVSANDTLLVPRNGPLGRQLTWADREGKVMGTVGESANYFPRLRLSPDGTRLAVSEFRGDAANLWLLDLSRGDASTRFTFGALTDTNPVWSPDGSRIIFNSNRNGPYDLYQKPTNGEKDEEVLLKSGENKTATSWSSDGRFLLYTVAHPKTKGDVWVLPLENGKKPVPFLSTEFNEGQAQFSPDGHWVAYMSDESGESEVYVRSFSMNSAWTAVEAGGKWQISNGFGVDPRWRGDGRELYYRSLAGRHLTVEIATHPAFRAGPPQPVGPLTGEAWDAAADGKRFLFVSGKGGPASYEVILNWQAGLKK